MCNWQHYKSRGVPVPCCSRNARKRQCLESFPRIADLDPKSWRRPDTANQSGGKHNKTFKREKPWTLREKVHLSWGRLPKEEYIHHGVEILSVKCSWTEHGWWRLIAEGQLEADADLELSNFLSRGGIWQCVESSPFSPPPLQDTNKCKNTSVPCHSEWVTLCQVLFSRWHGHNYVMGAIHHRNFAWKKFNLPNDCSVVWHSASSGHLMWQL